MLKRILLMLIVFWGASITQPVQASDFISWPRYSFEVINCRKPDCTFVDYGNPKTHWERMGYNVWSTYQQKNLYIVGVHCNFGTPGNYRGCYFTRDPWHAPPLVDEKRCKTTRNDNWVLEDPSACEVVPWVGNHAGLPPGGGECALLGKFQHHNQHIDTPDGLLTPDIVANSRTNQYCYKTYTPPEACDIYIPNGGVLDHGIQTANSQSERTLDVSIACGSNPIIKIVNPTLKMDGNRIQSDLSITRNGSNYLLRSVLNTTNATDGVHSASTIITVTAN